MAVQIKLVIFSVFGSPSQAQVNTRKQPTSRDRLVYLYFCREIETVLTITVPSGICF